MKYFIDDVRASAPLENKIQLKCKVVQVDYRNGIVTYVDHSDRRSSMRAKTILLTVPLGVLKQQSIDFIPPLPQSKLAAIEVVGFGVLNKCVFYWESSQASWWPEGKEVLTLVKDDMANYGNFTTFFNEKQLGNGGHFVLSAWTGGAPAKALESLSDEAIVEMVLENLRRMLGDKVPAPSGHFISRWGLDEFSYGSYTYSTVGSEALMDSARRELGARTGTNLFWAGEATHVGWSGSTAGAYLSGITAAEDVLFALQHSKVM
jgi:monoamine oxidase